MSLLQNSNAISSGGYNLESSLRFRSSASAYLSRTPTSTGDRQKFTVSLWVKRGDLGVTSRILFQQRENVNNSQQFNISFRSDDAIRIIDQNGGATVGYIDTNAVYRDTSSWYHIVVVRDSTNATADDRTKLYINGERVTSFLAGSNVALNYSSSTNTTDRILIGCQRPNSSSTLDGFYDGYMTEFNLVDGQALTADDFGETDTITGVWKPKEYTGTYGTNGFYLPMKETQQATGFNTVLYTGNGTSQDITGVGFTPDLVWHKGRSVAYFHSVVDSIRGDSNVLFTNATNAEQNPGAQLDIITDGFTTTYRSANLANNQSGQTYVAWCWDAGSSTVSNTDGSITSSVRANTTSGFSIVSYTGISGTGTIGHGLSQTPELIICKVRSTTDSWAVYHSSAGDGYLFLNSTAAFSSSAGYWGTPDSTTFGVAGTGTRSNNRTGETHIAYCFHSVAGYSKFGSYTGNGLASGPTVTTGFRPAFVMIKKYNGTGDWYILDNTRSPDNTAREGLEPNLSNAEASFSSNEITFTDTGFQITDNGTAFNTSGGTYIYMAFADTRDAQFNFDASGNKNNWTANNINSNGSSETTYDIMNDVATLTDEDTANFATINPLVNSTATGVGFADGNLTVSSSSSTNRFTVQATIGVNSGKWYWEETALVTGGRSLSGVSLANANLNDYLGVDTKGWGIYQLSGSIYNGSGAVSYGSGFDTAGDVLMTAFDADNNKIWWGKNGTWFASGDPVAGTNAAFTNVTGGEIFPSTGDGTTSGTFNNALNFGQRPFAYTPPTGYKKLNTYNLPDSTIKDGSQYFDIQTWTGDTTNPRSFSDTAFSPDLVWWKARNNAYSHNLFDSVRGATKVLYSNTTATEYVNDTSGTLKSFDSNGFTVGGDSNVNTVNQSGGTYVAWQWRASDSSPVSNTDGTITSTVSANPTSGFSIVTYTGTGANATVGHGLGSAPDMIIVKNRDNTKAWLVYHSANTSAPETDYLVLNDTVATADNIIAWNDTAPTSSVFSLGTSQSSNESGNGHVAYCFAEVEGFSKFGSYTGNGSADGPFVYTGFRPAFVIQKRTDTAAGWVTQDTARNTYNVSDKVLFPHSSGAENTGTYLIDAVSNGFKLRDSATATNASGGTYIYMAFAENPFKQSLAR